MENEYEAISDDHERIERIEIYLISGFVVTPGVGLVMYLINVPGLEAICRQINFGGLLLMSVMPGLVSALSFLVRKVDSQSPEFDIRQSLAEKGLIFFFIGSIAASTLAFKLSFLIGCRLLSLQLAVASSIVVGWVIGNIWRNAQDCLQKES